MVKKPFKARERIKSFDYAIQGLVTFFKTQHNSWIHLIFAIAVVVMGFILDINKNEWCWLIFAISIVLITEMFNTAIEFLTDLVSPQYDPLAKKVKDVAAAAVLIAALASVAIGIIIFLPKLF